MEPVRVPTAVGGNSTLMVQTAPTLRLVTQLVELTRKSPVGNTRSMSTGASPVLVTWMERGGVLVPPTARSANSRDDRFIDNVAVWVRPMPVVVKVCVPACVLSARVPVPVRVPALVGVKVARTKQTCPGLKV